MKRSGQQGGKAAATKRRLRLDVGEPTGFIADGVVEPSHLTDDEMQRLTLACGFNVEPCETVLWKQTRRLVADTIGKAVQPPARQVIRALLEAENELDSWSARMQVLGGLENHPDYTKPTSSDPHYHTAIFLRSSKHFDGLVNEIDGMRRHIRGLSKLIEKGAASRKASTKLPVESMTDWPRVFVWAGASLALPSKPYFDRTYPFAAFGIEMLRIAADRTIEAARLNKLPSVPTLLDDALKVAVSPSGAPSWALIQALARVKKEYRQRER